MSPQISPDRACFAFVAYSELEKSTQIYLWRTYWRLKKRRANNLLLSAAGSTPAVRRRILNQVPHSRKALIS
nr:MAG TPA: hypothetical protein [Caudoviricetes sp.]